MKKILICGATHGTNFGDFLFAKLFEETIKKENKDVKLYFTHASDFFENKLKLRVATWKELFKMDALIYMSGGFFGQSPNESLKESMIGFKIYYISGIITALRHKPIAIIGTGAGPLDRWFLRRAVVYILNRASVIAVRDIESYDYLVKYGVKKDMLVTSDTAQVIRKKTYEGNCNNDNLNKIKVLVHFSGIGREAYKDKIVAALQETLFLDDKFEYILAADQVGFSNRIDEIVDLFPKDRTTVYKYDEPESLLKVISLSNVIITAKLHVGIMGCTFGKSVLSFPRHAEKIIRYYRDIGYPERCLPIEDLNKEKAKEMIIKYANKNIIIGEDVLVKANKNLEILKNFINSI